MDKDYSYRDAGFDGFMSRSIDNAMFANGNLDTIRPMYMPPLTMAADRTQVSGQLGDTLQVGNIMIDGVTGRISVFDGNNEAIRIGNLGD